MVMGSGTKTKFKWMPPNSFNEEDWEAIRFCQNNNIIISPMRKGDKYRIGIAIGDHKKISYDKFEYDGDQVWDKVAEYSKYYHVKYRKQSDREDQKTSS